MARGDARPPAQGRRASRSRRPFRLGGPAEGTARSPSRDTGARSRVDNLCGGVFGWNMRFDRFTVKAQEALQQAQSIASERNHQEVDCEHMLVALLSQSDGLAQPLL